jgi:hypothetical protein
LLQQRRQVIAQVGQFLNLAIELFESLRNQTMDPLAGHTTPIPLSVRRRQIRDREADAERALNEPDTRDSFRGIASISGRRP